MAAKGVPDRLADVGAVAAPGRAVGTSLREQEGITRRVVLNLLEAFFRRPWLYLLPLLVLLALGASSAAGTPKEFRSIGTLRSTNDATLAELTEAAQTPGFSFQSPASITAGEMNEAFRTRQFIVSVAEGAGVDPEEADDDLLIGSIAGSLFAYADGENLVRVGAVTDDPQTSQTLASSALNTFTQSVVQEQVTGTETAEEILRDQIAQTEQQLAEAKQNLVDYVSQNNVSADPLERDVAQQVEIDAFNDEIARVGASLATQRDQLAAAELRTAEAENVVGQQLSVVDEARLPLAPEPRLQAAIFTIGLFAVLGLIVGITLLVLSAVLDHTVRVPGDITGKLGPEVLAVVPNVGR